MGSAGCNKPKTADAATALGLGAPQQNTILSGPAGPGMAHETPLGSLFGFGGTNPLAGIAGLNTRLQLANGGHDLMQPAVLLGSLQHQPVLFQPAQFLQMRHALAQQQATVVAAQHADIQNRIEAEAAKRAGELVKIEKEKSRKTGGGDANAT